MSEDAAAANLVAEPLTRAADLVAEHMALPAPSIDAVVLWCAVAHLHDELDISPFLAINSTVKRSGKSLLLDLIREMVPRPYAVGGRMGARVLATIIERGSPTLLIDEADTFLGGDAEMRGALNASQRRSGAAISRMSGSKTKQITTWAPKCLAGIGELPDTIADRSVRVRIERKRPSDRVRRWRDRDPDWSTLAERYEAWTGAIRAHFKQALDAGCAVPGALDDRAVDTWEPLIVAGDLAGAAWGARARLAAVALAAPASGADALAFAALREMDLLRVDAMHTSLLSVALSATLGETTDREIGRGLRAMGATSRNVTIGGLQAKGYFRRDIEAALSAAGIHFHPETGAKQMPGQEKYREDNPDPR